MVICLSSVAICCASVSCMNWIGQDVCLGGSSLSGALTGWGGREGMRTWTGQAADLPPWLRRQTQQPDHLHLWGASCWMQGLLYSFTVQWKWLTLALQPFLMSGPVPFFLIDSQIQHAHKDTHVTPRQLSAPSSKQVPTERFKVCTWPGVTNLWSPIIRMKTLCILICPVEINQSRVSGEGIASQLHFSIKM